MSVFILIMMLFAAGYALVWVSVTPAVRLYIGPRFIGAYAAMIMAGLFVPNWWGFYGVCLIVFIVTARDRIDAVCRYMLLAVLVPAVDNPLQVGGLYLTGLTTIHVLGIALLISMAVQGARPNIRPLRGLTAEDALVFVLFVIFSYGVTRFSTVSGGVRILTDQALVLVLPYIVIRKYVRSSEEFMRVMAAVGVAAMFLTVYGLYEARFGWSPFESIVDRQSVGIRVSKTLQVRGSSMRASTTFSTPLELATFLVLGFTAILCLRDAYRSRLMHVAASGLVLLGIVAAQSRGNLATLVLAVLIIAIARKKWGYASAIVAGAPLGLIGLLVLARNSLSLAAFFNTGNDSGEPYDYRQILLTRGLEEGAKHRWFGSSIEDVLYRLADITQGEHIVDLVNSYLNIYLVSGLFGFLAVVLLLARVVAKLVTPIRRDCPRSLRMSRDFTLASLAGMIVILAFMSFSGLVPFLVVILLAGARLVSVERSRLPGLRPTIAPPGMAETPPTPHRHGRRLPATSTAFREA